MKITVPLLPSLPTSFPQLIHCTRVHKIPPKVESHCQLPSSLVHWFYRNKTSHLMCWKGTGVPEKSTRNQICILLHLQAHQWHTSVTTQTFSLNRCDLFLVILVTKSGEFRFCCVRDCGEDLIKMQLIKVFPKR